jgi:hypothetical protein
MEVVDKLMLFVFGCIGITHILVDGEIFRPVKELISKYLPNFFLKLLNCYQCTGFWVGVIFGSLLYVDVTTIKDSIVAVFLAGGASSAFSYFWALVLTYLEANSIVKMNQNSEQNEE